MKIYETVNATRAWSRQCRASGQTVAFVPTMGSLHAGHLSLVAEARRRGDRVIGSIYVNPTQFGPNEDFGRYPRDPEGDLDKLRDAGCDAVFLPSALYVDPSPTVPAHETYVTVTELQTSRCGVSRPTFFRGVATVVTKLFNIVEPDIAVFGKKDYQQWRLVCRMVRDLDVPIEIVGMPVVREADGLAMSSRNARLTPTHRRRAPAIYRALSEAAAAVAAGERHATTLRTLVRDRIEGAGGRIDYVELSDALTLSPIDRVDRLVSLAVAAHFGDVRLIDNIEVSPKN